MATTTTADRSPAADAVRTPSVLVVLVTRDASRWLRECLQSLAAQTHPRLGVLAVDNGSTDGTLELLGQALGEQRVIALGENRGIAGALSAAMQLGPAQAADYVLLVHDDAALAPEAVVRMLEAAEGIRGVERVGVVGPKVVDWDDPRILREVGRSTDRFGHPYTPLQEGERDQGQYDRVLEVLFVSSAVMLISQEAWQRTGAFDERLDGHHDDLDFCWRARVAGFRVLMTPLATARHRGATGRGERQEHRHRSSRYYSERAALATMLKNYRLLTLLWLVPVYLVLGLARLIFLAVSRRFEDAYDVVASWGWNLLRLPGTFRRRIRAQRVRAMNDRGVRRFMASTLRLPRWFEQAEEFLDEGLEELEDEELGRPLPRRAASIAAGHPVLLGSVAAIALAALAVRHFVGPEVLSGGALATFPEQAQAFFRELVSGVRTTVLGGPQGASPSLAGLGTSSWVAFGSPALAQKALLGAVVPLAGVAMYRAMARETASPGPAVVAAASYALCGLSLWAFSEGRLDLLVAVALLPLVWDRLDAAFGRSGPERRLRFAVGLGVALAIAVSFLPAVVLPAGAFLIAHLLGGRRRGRGVALVLLSATAGALLAFPVLLAAAGDPAAATSSVVGLDDPWKVLRLVPGEGPGTWIAAAFLPLAAIVCFAGVGQEQRGRAWRAMVAAIVCTGLAWASARGLLPEPITNAPAYLAGAALAEAALVAYGLATFGSRLGRHAFGVRQLGVALLAVVLGVGLGAQALQVTLAEWAVGPGGLPAAWPVIDSTQPGEFRILWLGRPTGERFLAPGGDPIGFAEAGEASVRFGLTDRGGSSALDTGRGRSGPGYEELRAALGELLAGDTQHAGALLGPLGVRFLVAAEGDLPAATVARLDAQLDLDLVPAGGLVIYRNAAVLPVGMVTEAGVPAFPDPALVEQAPYAAATELKRAGADWAGSAGAAGTAVVADQFAGGWRVRTGDEGAPAYAGLGWAIAGPAGPGEVTVSFTDQWLRTAQMWALAVLWLAAMWITRKPVSA
jgi:GT2 family glycosyltransferase